MQGDYMALRYQVGNAIRSLLKKQITMGTHNSQDGKIIVAVDNRGVGTFKYIYDQQILAHNERLMQFRVRNGQVKFATNGFFFQEGTAALYEKAKYGEFRVSKSGELLLTGLRNEALEKLGP